MTQLPLRALPWMVALATLHSSSSAQCLQDSIQAPEPAVLDGFGGALDIQDDTLLSGAWTSAVTGLVHQFDRSASSWGWQETWVPSQGQVRHFGWSLQMDQDWAIVGAPDSPAGGVSLTGAVFFYRNTPNGWVESQFVENPDPGQQERFGYAVALDGETALVGLRSFTEGGAYVYEYDGLSWSPSAFLLPGTTAANSRFGSVLALHGSLAFVSAPQEDSQRGAVYVYERTAIGWSEVQRITKVGPGDRPRFGESLSYDPNTGWLAVGGVGHNSFDYDSVIGAVDIYERQGGTFVHRAEILQNESIANTFDDFGADVSLQGDDLLVGACEIGWLGQGAQVAYHFRRNQADDWEKVARFQPEAPHPYLDYGTRVLLDQGQVFVQEPGDGGGNSPAGRITVYSLPPLAVPYCACSQGPCSNEFELGGCANSQGDGAILRACGSSSVAADDLQLVVEGLPPAQFLVAAMGAGAGDVLFGDGRLCISGAGVGLFRYALTNADGSGRATIGPGLVQFAADTFNPAGQLVAGSTWNFQVWYRDPAGPCATGFNMSQALATTWTP